MPILNDEQISAIEFALEQGECTWRQAWSILKRSHQALAAMRTTLSVGRDPPSTGQAEAPAHVV